MTRKRKIETGLVEGRISTAIWKLAVPMMVGGALEDLFSMVDLYFVGRLGHQAVAALSIAGTVVAVLTMLVQGIGVGTLALVAQFIGRKEYAKADEVLGQTFLLAGMGTVLIYGARWLLVVPLLELFGAKGEVLNMAADYLRITFGWSGVIFFSAGINHAFRGSGDARTPLRALIIGNLLNIVLDPMMIMGYGGFPALGVAGSALATVASRGIGLIYLFLHLLFGHSTIHFRTRWLKPDGKLMREIIQVGSFASLQVLIREISFLFLMRLVASFGDETLAAYGVGSRIRVMLMVPGSAFAGAASVLTGQNLGANQARRAKKSAWSAVAYYQMLIIPAATIFLIWAPSIVGVFTDHEQVVALSSSYLRYLAVTFPFLGFSLVFSQALNGAGDTVTPTIINAIGQLLFRVPLAYLCALAFHMGPNGIWIGINGSDIVQGLGTIFIFRSNYWLKMHNRRRATMGLPPLAEDSGTDHA